MENSANTIKPDEVRVGGRTNVGTLCGFIHARLNEHGGVTLMAVGPQAINTAVKAIALARSQLQATSQDISVKPEFGNIIMDDIKVNDESLTEQEGEIIHQAIVVGATEPRTHVGMKLFVEYCSRITENRHNQNRDNSATKDSDGAIKNNSPKPNGNGKANGNSKPQNARQGKSSGKGRGKGDFIRSESEFLNMLNSNKVETNSNGIPRVK